MEHIAFAQPTGANGCLCTVWHDDIFNEFPTKSFAALFYFLYSKEIAFEHFVFPCLCSVYACFKQAFLVMKMVYLVRLKCTALLNHIFWVLTFSTWFAIIFHCILKNFQHFKNFPVRPNFVRSISSQKIKGMKIPTAIIKLGVIIRHIFKWNVLKWFQL